MDSSPKDPSSSSKKRRLRFPPRVCYEFRHYGKCSRAACSFAHTPPAAELCPAPIPIATRQPVHPTPAITTTSSLRAGSHPICIRVRPSLAKDIFYFEAFIRAMRSFLSAQTAQDLRFTVPCWYHKVATAIISDAGPSSECPQDCPLRKAFMKLLDS